MFQLSAAMSMRISTSRCGLNSVSLALAATFEAGAEALGVTFSKLMAPAVEQLSEAEAEAMLVQKLASLERGEST